MGHCLGRELGSELDIIYEGEGSKLAVKFYIPILKRTNIYYRLSGFFSVDSLAVISIGLAGLIKNSGKMRLIVGLHDVGPEIIEAYRLSRERAREILEEFGRKLSQELEAVADEIARRRIEALAWMLANGTLEIKVAMPRRTFLGLGNGIFHEKLMIFIDNDGCTVAAAGSANETRQAYETNGENLTVHMSWREGHMEYIRRYLDRFDALWQDKHPDYIVFPLPEVVERKIKERFYTYKMPEIDPLDSSSKIAYDYRLCSLLVPAAKLIQNLGETMDFVNLGIGPVILYPHQAYTVDYVLSRFPHRAILADEVGLGKTIEAGAIIKRLVSTGRARRVLILAPKNLTRQWLEEMWSRFGLRFWLFDPLKRAFVSADGLIRYVDERSNPFDSDNIDLIVASWHYVRGSRKRPPEILNSAKFFDLLVVDEAHNARRKRYLGSGKIESTRLFELISELSLTSPHLLLLTATPVQLYAAEALDLLSIIGVGGPWVDEERFDQYFKVLTSDVSEVGERVLLESLDMAFWFARHYLSDSDIERVLTSLINNDEKFPVVKQMIRGEAKLALKYLDVETVRKLLLAFNPLQWFMVRNTRDKLGSIGFRFPERDVREEPVELAAEHREILELLDRYLREEYGRYERMSSGDERSIIGLVKSVYYQRFVSSFTAAYITIKNRINFLRALLNGDRDALLRSASAMFRDVELEEDEEDVINEMEKLIGKVGRDYILREIKVLEDIEDRLRDYSPEVLSLSDPKLKKVAKVARELVNSGRKVLIFSKYTDTVDAVVRFLRKGGFFAASEIGVYTGEGGRLYRGDVENFVSVGKDDIVRRLSEGEIKVLVCSDAASEGLNLQAASAIINVDMPWNPAKVEQRIGRVDRIGQREEIVQIRNVWYPDSIEAQVYRALFLRRELYQIVVGPAQEIISDALRKILDEGETFESIRRIVDETLDKVEEVKKETAKFSGIYSGSSWLGDRYAFKELVERLVKFVDRACDALGLHVRKENGKLVFEEDELPEELRRWNRIDDSEGSNNALTPVHPMVRWLCDEVIRNGSVLGIKYPKSVYFVAGRGALWSVRVIEEEGGAQEELDSGGILGLLDELLEVRG